MTRLAFIRTAAITAIAALSCGFAAAADSQSITVSASVAGTCKLTTVNNMSFTLDPSVVSPGAATAAIDYKCTKGTAPTTFSVGGSSTGTYTATGANALAGTGTNTDTIGYTITWTAPTGLGTGFGAGSTATTVTLTGAIPYVNFANVAADTYSKQVTISIAN